MLGIGLLPRCRRRFTGRGFDHRFDRQFVIVGKLEVALIMGRHRHYRAFAVTHQHIVGDPQRQLLAGERVGDAESRRHTFLLLGGDLRLGGSTLLALLDEGRQFWIALRRMQRQRMLGGNGHIGSAHQGVGPGGEDPQGTAAVDRVREADAHTVGFADPVALHGAHLLRPVAELI